MTTLFLENALLGDGDELEDVEPEPSELASFMDKCFLLAVTMSFEVYKTLRMCIPKPQYLKTITMTVSIRCPVSATIDRSLSRAHSLLQVS
jgi:hypothetical protein